MTLLDYDDLLKQYQKISIEKSNAMHEWAELWMVHASHKENHICLSHFMIKLFIAAGFLAAGIVIGVLL